MIEKKILCGTEWIETPHELIVKNSWNGNPIGKTFLAGRVELNQAIESAEKVFPKLKSMGSYEKYTILMKMAELYKEHIDEATQLIILETSKPYKYAKAEAERAYTLFQMAAEESRRISGEYHKADWLPSGQGKEAIVKYFPIGIIAGISPFNFPLNLVAHKVAPAIAAGCPIIIKPARSTPFSSIFMAELALQAGLPKGAFSVLPMDREAGNQLVTDDRISVLTFTGSPEVGWQMKKEAGRKKVILELGSNAALIIDQNSNWQKAISRIVMGAFSFSGQICIHTQRIFVHQDIYNEFVKEFVEATKSLKFGDPHDPQTDVSAMIDETNAIRVEDWINEAKIGGAKILCGGNRKGTFVEPTIISNVKPQMKVCCQEVFGPVVVIEAFEHFAQAVDMVNASRFGLQAGIYTDSITNMDFAFDQIEAGGIIINDVPTYRADHLPYGGMKDSGQGREGVKYAMMDYLDLKVLIKSN